MRAAGRACPKRAGAWSFRPQAPSDGEASFGVSLGESGPVTGFFEANARFGSTEGGGLRAGVKLTF